MVEFFARRRVPIVEKIHTKKYGDDILNTRYWLAYCILSSGVKDSQAIHLSKEITDTVYNREYTTSHEYIIKNILQKRHEKKWKYRFPNVRSCWVHDAYLTLQTCNNSLPCEVYKSHIKLRDNIVNRFKGVGYKQASLLLRSLNVSFDCCVIDTHIIDFFILLGYIPADFNKNNIKRKAYIALEVMFKQISEKIKVPMPILDMAVWDVTRLMKTEKLI